MTLPFLLRLRLLLAGALLAALVQGGGAAHAAAAGDAPHEHDGVICAVASQAEREDDDAAPPPVIGLAMPIPPAMVFVQTATHEPARAPFVVPQGRGPPAPGQTTLS